MMTDDLNSFFIRQINQINEEGSVAVKRKLMKLSQKLISLPLIISSVPIVVLIRLFRPWLWIRFGHIRSDVIGHCVYDPEYYLSEQEVLNENYVDCFYYQSGSPPNIQWDLMLRRTLRIHPIFRYFDQSNRLLPGGELHHKVTHVNGSRDIKGYLEKTIIHIKFTQTEDDRGKQFLNNFGLSPEDRFVCMIVRDSAYKEEMQKWKSDWSYHNYRDSDIDTFKVVAFSLAEKGYWVFRMGKKVHKPFKVDHSHVVDYANSYERSDFLDLWLMANCHFCISTGTGLDEIARIYQRPAVYVNYLPFSLMVSYDHVINNPKHLVWKETNKRLTLSEHLEYSYGRSDDYDKANIEVEDLTAEEILKAVLELEARLNGSWEGTEMDTQQQSLFWELLQSHEDFKKFHGVIHPEARVGAHFLRNNPEWLN
jgi:putative glycosyltransferase (TIGR04372 family)